MGQGHGYGLSWIDEGALYEVTRHVFSKAIEKSESDALTNPPDPFTIATQAVLMNQAAESMLAFEKLRAINKTISNAVGSFHQQVLGLAEGWTNLGTSGGVVDLVVQDKESGKPIHIEVKNRFNTIKASDEKELWDKLDLLARTNGSVSYLVQIVPKTPERYNRPWNVSGREARDHVRCCDGATAYEWAFGNPKALEELYQVFPLILSDIIGTEYNNEGMLSYYNKSMPL